MQIQHDLWQASRKKQPFRSTFGPMTCPTTRAWANRSSLPIRSAAGVAVEEHICRAGARGFPDLSSRVGVMNIGGNNSSLEPYEVRADGRHRVRSLPCCLTQNRQR